MPDHIRKSEITFLKSKARIPNSKIAHCSMF